MSVAHAHSKVLGRVGPSRGRLGSVGAVLGAALILFTLVGPAQAGPAHRTAFGVDAHLDASTVAVGGAAVVSGAVSPAAPGDRVKLQRDSDSGWHTVDRVSLDARSRYSLVAPVKRTGLHRLRVVKPTTTRGLRAVSPVLVLTGLGGVDAPSAAHSWVDLSTGGTHSCGVRDDGTLWCWGETWSSVNGNDVRLVPEQVGTVATWTDVEVGVDHACAVREDGSAWCWGNNPYGELGVPASPVHRLPVRVGTMNTWTRVVPALSSTCGLRDGGFVYCWGFDSGGLHGDGEPSSHSRPLRVGSFRDWTSLTTGHSHYCGTRSDGSAWCWGYNWAGAVGDGSTTDRSTPTRVGMQSDWVSLAAGAYGTCGVRAAGSLWCWVRTSAARPASTTPASSPPRTGSARARTGPRWRPGTPGPAGCAGPAPHGAGAPATAAPRSA